MSFQKNTIVVQPLASVREARYVPGFELYANLWGYDTDDPRFRFYGGYFNGQLVGYGVVREDADIPKIIMVHSAVEGKGLATAITQRILLHYPRILTKIASPGGEAVAKKSGLFEANKGVWVKEAGQEGKDILQAPIPFVYDVEKDFIAVGHPGQKTHDVEGDFTPGLVEGYYEPKGKVVITTKTSIPYSNYHFVRLWYALHPSLEVTSVEYAPNGGKKIKLAAENVADKEK